MESGNIVELADTRMEGKYDAEQLYRVVLTASYCVRQTAICRPAMTEVNYFLFFFFTFNCKLTLYFQIQDRTSLNQVFSSFLFYIGARVANKWPKQ